MPIWQVFCQTFLWISPQPFVGKFGSWNCTVTKLANVATFHSIVKNDPKHYWEFQGAEGYLPSIMVSTRLLILATLTLMSKLSPSCDTRCTDRLSCAARHGPPREHQARRPKRRFSNENEGISSWKFNPQGPERQLETMNREALFMRDS